MQRRTFLGGLLAASLAGVWRQALAAQPVGLPAGQALAPLAPLANRAGTPGHFAATLIAEPVGLSLLPGHRTEFWAYNGSVPGPLIELYEGDTVEIEFVNRLAQPSTIHWHGLPVPPSADGNPHDPVAPGARRSYRFTVPDDAAGTYWYHPHPHGHTAEQAFRGLAGPLIVRARHDPLAGIAERHLLVSDLKLDAHGDIADNDANDWMNGREGQYALVNGQLRPTLAFAAAGRERWRVWNACSARYLRLQLPGSTLTLVGTDGGLIETPQAGLGEYLLAPGERAELVIDAGPRRDRAALVAAVYDRGKMGDVPPDRPVVLADVDFAGVGGQAGALPQRLATLTAPGAASATHRVEFGEAMNGDDMLFLINGRRYDMARIDFTGQAGRVEQWEVVNGSDMDHPFHLHGTQFQVLERERDGVKTPERLLARRDTVNLRPGETVRLAAVQRWPGIRMFHCHILEHEDAGMMGQIRID